MPVHSASSAGTHNLPGGMLKPRATCFHPLASMLVRQFFQRNIEY